MRHAAYRRSAAALRPVLAALLLAGSLAGCRNAPPLLPFLPDLRPMPDAEPPVEGSLRVATYNAALSGVSPADLEAAVAQRDDPQLKLVAEVIQRVRPDVLLLQEFDLDPTGRLAQRFIDHYLKVPQRGARPIDYPYTFSPEVNTGIPSTADLNGDGELTVPEDAHGWGEFAGQYGMLVLSRFPIDAEGVTDFRTLRWADVPDARLPAGYYSEEAQGVLRLSSKTHAVVPVTLGDGTVLRLMISHPTPPVFDGAEDRNGLRNADEIRLWADYLTGGESAAYLGASFPRGAVGVLLGDLNADPYDGDSVPGAIQQLLDHPVLQGAYTPHSIGAIADAEADGPPNAAHRTLPAHDTADFSEPNPGNLRVDYAIPTLGLRVTGKGVYWPAGFEAMLNTASDHRLVWVDVVPGG